jgi:formate dehydrogenase subunit delta
MKIERLATMANEISAFFAAAETEDGAPPAVAAHLRKFWTPAMRAQLARYATEDGAALSPLARRAALLLDSSSPG